MSQVPVPGPFRPAPPAAGTARPVPGPAPARPGWGGPVDASNGPEDGGGSGHPAVDAVLQAMANAANLPPADQIAQYEAAHQTLRETLATIDQT